MRVLNKGFLFYILFVLERIYNIKVIRQISRVAVTGNRTLLTETIFRKSVYKLIPP